MDITTTNGKSKAGAAKATDQDAVIFIQKLEVVRTTVEVEGISPLIVHAWSEKAKTEMRSKQQKLARSAKSAKDPEADFNGSRYIDAEGRDCFPAIAFKGAAVEAGVLAGVFKTSLRKAFFVGGPGQELLPIICPEGPNMREDMVRLNGTTADLRYRAEYRNWRVKIPVELNPRIISPEQLFNLFDSAGYSIGVGEWRPQRNGQYGRFRVVLS